MPAPDKQQQRCIETILAEKQTVLTALAGSGKTSHVIMPVFEESNVDTLLLVYNKHNADDHEEASLLQKIQRGETRFMIDFRAATKATSTIHSIGFAALRAVLDTTIVDPGVAAKWLKNHLKSSRNSKMCHKMLNLGFFSGFMQLINVAREMGYGVESRHGFKMLETDQKTMIDLAVAYNCYPGNKGATMSDLAWRARKYLDTRITRLKAGATTAFDHIDQIWAPLFMSERVWNEKIHMWARVIVDEAQDCSPTRLELVFRLLKPGGHICFGGDDRQGIYLYEGAVINCLQQLANLPEMKKLILPYTYRVPRSHCKWVNENIEGPKIRNRASVEDGEFIEVRMPDDIVELFHDFTAEELENTMVLGLNKYRTSQFHHLVKDQFSTPIDYRARPILAEETKTIDEFIRVLRETGKQEYNAPDEALKIYSGWRAKGLEADTTVILGELDDWAHRKSNEPVYYDAIRRNMINTMVTRARKRTIYVKGWYDYGE